jgi:O-Antigen ligase
VFGLSQLLLGLLRISPPFVEQWWIPGILARINGFSYEPSYFATYLLIGWTITAYLKFVNSEVFSKKTLNIYFFVLLFGILLSGSRIGWAIITLWFLQYPILFVINFVRGKVSTKESRIIIAFIASLLFLLMIVYSLGADNLSFLLQGTGIGDNATHSVDGRSNAFTDTLAVFLESPIIGYSLGGVAPAIANLHGVITTNNELAKQYEGLNVFAEVLAASGVIGFIPFCLYIYTLLNRSRLTFKKIRNKNPLIGEILASMTSSLFIELFALQFSPTILRVYLWVHIAILSAVLRVASLSARENVSHFSKVIIPDALGSPEKS